MHTIRLYHVSFDPVPCFIPRVPQDRLETEDAVTKRICLSTSITHCLNARPSKGDAIAAALRRKFKLCLFVYAADVPIDQLVTPAELTSLHGVTDAEENQEYWALTPQKFTQQIYVLQDAELSDAFYTAPTVFSVKLQEVGEVPKDSIFWQVQKLNSLLQKNIQTDYVVGSFDELFDENGKLLESSIPVARLWLCN